MVELTELDSATHGNLKVSSQACDNFVARQQIIRLRAVEISKAAASFPIFFNRNPQNGHWTICALAGFASGSNLFMQAGHWLAMYKPTSLQTYPFYLMKSPTKENGFCVGIDEGDSVFSESQGDALFDQKGRASAFLSQKSGLLEADIKHDFQTSEFATSLQKLSLLKSIDVLVDRENSNQILQGLYTINEDKLQSLRGENLEKLHTNGYLTQIHAMLISLFQLNNLVQKNNQQAALEKIKQVKLEVSRDRSAL